MSSEPGTAREAAERNAQAVLAGNLSQLMADITPEALSQMMQMGAAAGGLAPSTMPNIQGYEIEEQGPDGDGEVFHVTFSSSIGTATVSMKWKRVMDQWKITDVGLISAEPVTEGGTA
jgi:hypothetical protein